MSSLQAFFFSVLFSITSIAAASSSGDDCRDRSAELYSTSGSLCSTVVGRSGFDYHTQGCGSDVATYCPVSCGLCLENETVRCSPEQVQANKQPVMELLWEMKVFESGGLSPSNASTVYMVKNATALTQRVSAGYSTLDPNDPCGFPGITCNRCGEAIHIQLGAPLRAPLPGRLGAMLFQFSHLQELYVDSSTWSIEEQTEFPSDWWTNLSQLVVLHIEGMLKGSYPALHALSNLSQVRLNRNHFDRDDPVKLFGPSLASFQIMDAELDWVTPGHALPATICNTQLTTFIMFNPGRRFEGLLPSCMQYLFLTFVLLTETSLSGPIAPILSSPWLFLFSCITCAFSGSLPDTVSSMRFLSSLVLSEVELTGWIPNLADMQGLRTLTFSKTAITGIHGFPMSGPPLTAILSDNAIANIGPGWFVMPTVVTLDVSRNDIRSWPAAGVYPFDFFYSNGAACADPEVPRFQWPNMKRLLIDENPLQNGSIWSVLKSITYLPLTHVSAVACGLAGSLEMENAALAGDVSYECNNRFVSAGFQSLTSLSLNGNKISAINGPPWTALLVADLSGNSLTALHPQWYGAAGGEDIYESALLTLSLEDNPDLRIFIEPPDKACGGKDSDNLRGDPNAFSAAADTGYECTVLCHSGQTYVGISHTANATALCRCQAGFYGVGTDCKAVPPDHWSLVGFQYPSRCPDHSSTLGDDKCSSIKCCYCEAGYYMELHFDDCKGKACPYGRCQSCPSNTFLAQIGAFEERDCVSCASGTYSSPRSTACVLCPNGSIAASPEPGFGCKECEPGKFVTSNLASECSACPKGQFQPLSGRIECTQCPPLHTTWEARDDPNEETPFKVLLGARSEAACGCEKHYRSDGQGHCIRCGSGSQEGLSCPGGLDDRGVTLEPGYYAEVSGFHYSIYRCSIESPICKGGHYSEVCALGRTGLRCDMCLPGKVPGANGTCVACREGPAVSLALIVAGCFLALGFLYRAVDSNSNTPGRDHLVLAAAIAFSIFVSLLQHLGVMAQLHLSWEEPLLSIMTVLRVVILDMRLVPTGCVIPLEPFAEFLMKFVVVVAAVLVLCLVHVATVAVKHNLKFRNHWAPLLGAVGTFASIVFIAVMSAALGPFRCFTHPNGKWTSGVYGSVVCWETAEHTRLVVMAFVFLLIPLCWLTWVVLLVYQYRARVEQLDMDFLRASFFVHSRFRPEVHWFILVPMVRGIFSTLALVIPDVVLTVLFLQLSTLMACYITVRYRPWRVDSANLVDLTTNVGLLLLLGFALVFLPHESDADHARTTTATLALCLTLGVLMALPLFFLQLLLATCSRQQKQYEYFLCHHKAGTGAFGRLLKMCLSEADPSSGVFFEMGPLESLHVLLYTIQEETEVFILLGSGDVFTKSWCVAELAAAKVAKVKLMIVEMPDYARPSRSFIDELELHIDMAELIERGLSVAATQVALEEVCTHPSIAIPENLNSQAMADLVSHIQARTTDARVHYQRQPVVGQPVCILADQNSREAAAAALIVEKVYASITDVKGNRAGAPLCFALPPDAGSIPQEVSAVAMLCSSGCLESTSFIRALTRVAMLKPIPNAVPVMIQDSFRFPTKAWHREYLQNNRTMEAPALVTFVKATFTEIAVLFQPQHVPEAMLINQGCTIVKRLTNKKRRAVDPDRSTSEGGSCETLQPLDSPEVVASQLNHLSDLAPDGAHRVCESHSSSVTSCTSCEQAHSDTEVPCEGNDLLLQPEEAVIIEIRSTN